MKVFSTHLLTSGEYWAFISCVSELQLAITCIGDHQIESKLQQAPRQQLWWHQIAQSSQIVFLWTFIQCALPIQHRSCTIILNAHGVKCWSPHYPKPTWYIAGSFKSASSREMFYWKFLPNFNLKNMISIYTKDFSWKKMTQLQEKNSESPDFYDKFQ